MESVEFRPSIGFITLSALSPALLLGLGAWGVLQGGDLRLFPAILVVLGIGLAAVGAIDVPYKITVDEVGVQRRCLLRRQRFPWDDIVAFRRPQARRGRRGVGGLGAGGRDAAAALPASGKGGLILETVARRRYLLSLGQELPTTYGAIEEAVRRYAPGLSMPGPPHYARSDTPL